MSREAVDKLRLDLALAQRRLYAEEFYLGAKLLVTEESSHLNGTTVTISSEVKDFGWDYSDGYESVFISFVERGECVRELIQAEHLLNLTKPSPTTKEEDNVNRQNPNGAVGQRTD